MPPYTFTRVAGRDQALQDVAGGAVDAALIADRRSDGSIGFTFFTGEGVGADRTQLISVGTLAVGILDWTANQQVVNGQPFHIPSLDVIAAAGPTAGGAPISSAEFAGRRIVGVVFIVLIFIIVVIYGMWVAAGVVAEKTSRVMELIISAASARQLVIGKVTGIGLAGLTQYVGVLVPALIALAIEDRVSAAISARAIRSRRRSRR